MATVCVERKLTLAGATHEYHCQLLLLEPGFGVLRYSIDRSYEIAGMHLRPGDITYALYWTDRPYTLYVWLTGSGFSYYFNIADSVVLSPALFSWRDLAVDVLIDPHGMVHVLDEHEVPGDVQPDLLLFIRGARDLVLASWQDVAREADRLISSLRAAGR